MRSIYSIIIKAAALLLALALCCPTALATTMDENLSLGMISVKTTSLNPLTAAILGTVFLHERLGLWGLAGAALILTGILIQSLGERQKAPRLAKA